MQIEYSKKAAKYISGLDRPTKQRIKKRLRVGKYRIIYNYLPNGEIEILYIINVDSRGDIYK